VNTFSDYLRDSWPAVVFALFFMAVNPWSFVALLRTASARKERLRQAREELADLVESQLVRNKCLPRQVLYQLARALAAKRDVKAEDVYRPIPVLEELLLRLRRNPGLDAAATSIYEEQIQRLITEFKCTEGLDLLDEVERALGRAPKDYKERERARRLILLLSTDWAGYHDQVTLSQLRNLAARLRIDKAREAASELIGYLKQDWAQRGKAAGLLEP
jgi:hypothetical protein